MTQLENRLYTAKLHTASGRLGAFHSSDGRPDSKHSISGSTPEQLFVVLWPACFQGAIGLTARKLKVALKFLSAGSICTTSILGGFLVCGCNTHPVKQYPWEIGAVVNALAFNELSNVQVSQDRVKGVMTLTGNVPSESHKALAGKIAAINASDYTIANDVVVTPPSAQPSDVSDSQR